MPSCILSSTVAKNDNDVNTGRMKRPSGVVKSVNQYAPPPLREGTFSTMFDIAKKKLMNIGPCMNRPFNGVNGVTPCLMNSSPNFCFPTSIDLGSVEFRISSLMASISGLKSFNFMVDFIWLMSIGTVSNRMSTVVSAIVAHQLRPVKDCTASRRYCRAATGGNDSAAAAATSPAYGAGGTGTEAAAETTWSETGTEEAASVSMSAATSMSGADAEEVVEKLRWAARWSAKGRGRLVRARDLDGRAREEGIGLAGCD
jgi:hypothetical protein